MAKVRTEPQDGSNRVLVFDAQLQTGGSGRSVSGIVAIHYGTLDDDLQAHIRNNLQPGKYKLVVQRKRLLRWVHVASSEVVIAIAPS